MALSVPNLSANLVRAVSHQVYSVLDNVLDDHCLQRLRDGLCCRICMMVQSHQETCMDCVKGILCILVDGDNDVLKDDVILGQIVILVQVCDVPCKLVENPRRPFCRCQVPCTLLASCKTCPMYPRLKTVTLFSETF